MGVIDMFLINHENIMKGFEVVLGIKNYLLVKDKEDSLICATYDIDAGRALAEEYLKRQGLEKTLVKFEKKSIKNKNEQIEEICMHKIVLLDKELVLYKDVEKKAKEYVIDGYDGKLPIKYKINKYTTVSKK